MTNQKQIWKCEICGNIIEVLHSGADSLVCCGQPMTLQKEKTQEEGKEKHLPIIEGKKVKVSTTAHPMTKEHYIEWIEANGEQTAKVFLKPGEKPESEVCFNPNSARAYCNIHGLWKG